MYRTGRKLLLSAYELALLLSGGRGQLLALVAAASTSGVVRCGACGAAFRLPPTITVLPPNAGAGRGMDGSVEVAADATAACEATWRAAGRAAGGADACVACCFAPVPTFRASCCHCEVPACPLSQPDPSNLASPPDAAEMQPMLPMLPTPCVPHCVLSHPRPRHLRLPQHLPGAGHVGGVRVIQRILTVC